MDSTARRVQPFGFLTPAILVAWLLLCRGTASANSIAAADLEIQGVSLRVIDTAVTTGVDIPVCRDSFPTLPQGLLAARKELNRS